MTGIIFSQAWACNDKDCAAQWHQRNFWAYSDGTFSVDEYSDGDHEDCDESDLPSHEEIGASWREYSQHVLATGKDPLGNYYVKRESRRNESWFFSFGKSIVGPVLLRARHGRREVPASELPQHVREYLNLDKRGLRLLDFKTWDELAEALPNAVPGQWVKQSIEHRASRKPEIIARELRAAARRAIARATGADQ